MVYLIEPSYFYLCRNLPYHCWNLEMSQLTRYTSSVDYFCVSSNKNLLWWFFVCNSWNEKQHSFEKNLTTYFVFCDSHPCGALSGTMVAWTIDLAGAMRISVLKMDQRLMAVTASNVSAWGTRCGSARPDKCLRFHHRGDSLIPGI